MSNNNILSQKTEDILSKFSMSDFPTRFECMYNIKLKEINKLDAIKIQIDYECTQGEKHNKLFTVKTIQDENIVLRPKELIGTNHILLLENNGPFIIQR